MHLCIQTGPSTTDIAPLRVSPSQVRYIARDVVEITLRPIEGGQSLLYTMKASALVKLVTISVGVINQNTPQALRDLNLFD